MKALVIPAPPQDDGYVLVVTPAEFTAMNRIIADGFALGADPTETVIAALRAAGMSASGIENRRGMVTRLEVREGMSRRDDLRAGNEAPDGANPSRDEG